MFILISFGIAPKEKLYIMCPSLFNCSRSTRGLQFKSVPYMGGGKGTLLPLYLTLSLEMFYQDLLLLISPS